MHYFLNRYTARYAQGAKITIVALSKTPCNPNLFRYLEMINLDVFSIEFLEITELSVCDKLAPAVGLILGRVLFIGQLLQGLDLCVVCWAKEEGNGKPFLL